MLIFISSTYRDLIAERQAVQQALSQGEVQPWGMEFFNSSPDKPLSVCIENVRACDAVVLLVGGRAGSLVPSGGDRTYTGAEIEVARLIGRPIFPFILLRNGKPPNDERPGALFDALESLRSDLQNQTPAYFSNLDELKFEVLATITQWDKKGRPGARKTLASVDEYFAEYAARPAAPRLFDFEQTLVGRGTEMAELKAFLAAPTKTVLVLSGRGGIGKTRLLLEIARAADAPGVLFLRRDAVWHLESDKEVPAGDVVIIADDAHLDPDLLRLSGCIKSLRAGQRCAKLIISCRPRGLAAVDPVLANEFDPSEIVRMKALDALDLPDVRHLAMQELGKAANPVLVEWLVSASADTPLVTVAGARLLKQKRIDPAELKSSEDFQRLVFDRFVDELDAVGQPFPVRKLIDLIAALAPESFRSDPLADAAAQYLACERHELSQALSQLEEWGILIHNERGFRVAPDALADWILQQACAPHEASTGFAEFVLNRFGPYGKYGQVLANFAEVDWRVARQTEGQVSILGGVWERLVEDFRAAHAGGRCEILTAIRGAALYTPATSMNLYQIAVDSEAADGGEWWPRKNSDVLEILPEVLRAASYHLEYTQAALSGLLELWRRGVRRAATEARNLAKMRPGGSEEIARESEILAAIDPVMTEACFYGADQSILDMVDEVLAREVEWNRSSETALELLSYPLNYPAVRPLRQQCLKMLDRCLSASEPRVAMRALRSLLDVLEPFQPKLGRHELTAQEDQWQDDERMTAIGILSGRALGSTAPLALRQQIFAALRQHDLGYYSESVESKFQELLSRMPVSEDYSSFDAFVTPHWYWERMTGDDVLAHEARYRGWVGSAVDHLVESHTTPAAQVARLEELARLFDGACIKESASFEFVLALAQRHPPFVPAFIEYVARSPLPLLGLEIRAILGPLRESSFESYLTLGLNLAGECPELRGK